MADPPPLHSFIAPSFLIFQVNSERDSDIDFQLDLKPFSITTDSFAYPHFVLPSVPIVTWVPSWTAVPVYCAPYTGPFISSRESVMDWGKGSSQMTWRWWWHALNYPPTPIAPLPTALTAAAAAAAPQDAFVGPQQFPQGAPQQPLLHWTAAVPPLQDAPPSIDVDHQNVQVSVSHRVWDSVNDDRHGIEMDNLSVGVDGSESSGSEGMPPLLAPEEMQEIGTPRRPPALNLDVIDDACIDESKVAQIMDMGFGREMAVEALKQHTSVQDAVMSLLG